MPFMLIILFAFALLVTCAGFFLSFKSHADAQETLLAQSRTRSVQRVMDNRRRVESIPRMARSGRVVGSRSNPALSISSLGVRVERRQAGEPVPWTVVVIGAVSVFVLGVFAFNLVMPHNPVFNLTWLSNSSSQSQPTPAAAPPTLYGASQNVVRIGQLDTAQYNSTADYSLWAFSACSSAAMTEVINAYGHHYRIADILKVEASLNEITPALGLVEDVGVARTMAQFGFKTNWGYSLSYDQVVATANQGEPVIVSWPPSRYAGGHLVVVIAGNSQTIYIADSSIYNRHSLSRTQFMKWWAGFSAVATPQ
jgi:Peptidase_C39 like family